METQTLPLMATVSISIPFERIVDTRNIDLIQIGSVLVHRPVECRTAAGNVLANSWALPFQNGAIGNLHCENALEFVRDDVAFRDELTRILAPGGRLILQVPNQSRVAGLDSLNLYRYLIDISHRGRKPVETVEVGWRRRYSLADIVSLLGDDFVIDTRSTRQVGLSELVNFGAMAVRGWLRDPMRRPFGLNGSLDRVRDLEERIPTGDWGSILTVQATRK